MLDFSVTPAIPPSNTEIEMAVLGSILIDSSAIYQVAEILPVEAFHVDAHKDIYQACIALYKHQKRIDLLSVTSWLADKNLLHRVGGQNKLATIVDSTVHSLHVKEYADVLIEKHVRRQLQKIGSEFDRKAYEQDEPLAYILEKLEKQVLGITQLRNTKNGGYWQRIDDIAFERLCKELEEVEAIENAAQQDWSMRKLAKNWDFRSKKDLLDFHAKWLDSKNKIKTYSAQEYFQKHGLTDQDWLIPGFVPNQSVIVLYAGGGEGKTRLAFSMAKSAVSGGTFAYEGTEFDPMNTLLIETDQGPRVTSKLLEMQELHADQSSQMFICDEWSVGEFGRLKAMLKQHQPKLVIIDSLTSISVDSLYSENDTEYARPLVRLRHIAKDFNCSFLVIHHANASGGMRGSRAIQNTVDEVWKFSKVQTEVESYNVLTIEKTRARAPGSYKFTYDEESWGWKFGGRVEDNILSGLETQSTSIMIQCCKFLKRNSGIPYEALEVAEALGLNRDSVRRDLKRAANEGLINSGRSSCNKRALVYYSGSRMKSKENITTDQLINLTDQPLITSLAMQGKGSGLSDQLINENQNFLEQTEKKLTDHFDQLITSSQNLDTATKLSDQPELITSDQFSAETEQPATNNTNPPRGFFEHKKAVLKQSEVYWHPRTLRRVKVVKTYKTHSGVDVFFAGEVEVSRVDISELTQIPTTDLKSGESVEVIAGKHKGLKAVVSTIDPKSGIWLKKSGEGFNPAIGPFEAFQLKRVE